MGEAVEVVDILAALRFWKSPDRSQYARPGAQE
jgi:hypothetical protein